MAARYFACEAVLYRTGANVDGAFAAYGGSIEGNQKAAEASLECSAVKVLCSEAQGDDRGRSF